MDDRIDESPAMVVERIAPVGPTMNTPICSGVDERGTGSSAGATKRKVVLGVVLGVGGLVVIVVGTVVMSGG